MSDEVTFTIDGREVTVPKGTLVIRAAEQLGIVVPRFCDHPLLDPVGACRQCVVDVEGQRKPLMACTTTAQDGMEVRTHLTSDVARKAQEGTLEFLLVNHPLDCPMCDKGGECPLQDQALAHGRNVSRFVDQKRRYLKPVAVSPQVLLDRERCVLCARCTRFSEQISGDPFIELFERGALEQVAIYEDEPYRSYFSGNVIQICPVGALTSASYRFKARPFDLRSAPSVCNHCSAGCTLTIQSRRGRVERQLARTNMPVNEAWNCDKGRFAYKLTAADARLRTPLVRDGDALVDAPWSDALLRSVRALRDAGPGRTAVVTGGRLADEDAYVVAKYARTVLRTDHVDFRTRFAPAGEVGALGALEGRATATYADVERAPLIVVVGLDPEEEVPILHLRLRKAWRNHKARIVGVGPRLGSLAPIAWRWLATVPGGEAVALTELGHALGVPGAAAALTAGDPAAVSARRRATATDPDEVATALRDAERPVVLVGERAPDGALAAAGRLADHLGGLVAWVPRRAGARGALDAGLAAGLLPGGRRRDDADDAAAVAGVWGELPDTDGLDLRGILEAAADGRIDVLHLIGVDLARDAADPELARRALGRATVVLQDLAHTDTTPYADVVLPATATQERGGSFTDWEGRTQRFQPAISGPDLVQDDWEIVVQLAALLGHDLGVHDLDGIRAERERLGVRAQPRDWPGARADAPAESDGLKLLTYPLLLDRGTLQTGADDLARTAREPFAALHPADADAIDVADGEPVRVVGAGDATLRLPVRLEESIAPGVVFVPANSTELPARALGGGATYPDVHVHADVAEEVGA